MEQILTDQCPMPRFVVPPNPMLIMQSIAIIEQVTSGSKYMQRQHGFVAQMLHGCFIFVYIFNLQSNFIFFSLHKIFVIIKEAVFFFCLQPRLVNT